MDISIEKILKTAVFFLSIFLIWIPVLSQEQHDHLFYSIPKEGFQNTSLSKHCFLTNNVSGKFSEKLIDSLYMANFTESESINFDTFNTRTWGRFQILVTDDKNFDGFISLCNNIDSFELYMLSGDSLLFLGASQNNESRTKRYFYHQRAHLSVFLQPGLHTYYFRTTVNSKMVRNHLGHLFLYDGHSILNETIQQHGFQFFYIGAMLIFILFSLFLFINFQERIFIYFSFLMFFLALYFCLEFGFISAFWVIPEFMRLFLNFQMIISGVLVFGYLLLSNQLDLNKYWHSYDRFYGWTTGIIVLYSLIYRLILRNYLEIAQLLNILLLFWIGVTLVAVLQGVIRKRIFARVLLISIIILLVGGFIHILAILNVLKSSPIIRPSFQTGSILFAGTIFYSLFDRLRKIQNDKLAFRIEKEKSESLLYNILPENVANELKETGKSPTRSFPQVTVLFTDFKNFTALTVGLPPEVLVNEINACYEAFDEITNRYGIEKIKTIGDSYMAAGGLSEKDDDTVRKTVYAALEMNAFIKTRKIKNEAEGRPVFEMRLGLHTGPVVAGVVGHRKFQYDIWGDTVNTASRMESYSEPGKVNVSQFTYEIINDTPDLHFISRGKISAKGKGEIEMWYVEKIGDPI